MAIEAMLALAMVPVEAIPTLIPAKFLACLDLCLQLLENTFSLQQMSHSVASNIVDGSL